MTAAEPVPVNQMAEAQKISALGNFLIRAGQKLNRTSGAAGSANSGNGAGDLSAALNGVAPKFAVYFDAAPDAIYQIAMWVKHFDAVHKEYVYIVRRADLIAPLQSELDAAGSSAKILLAKTHVELEQVAQMATLSAVLYVNNTARNSDMVRFAHLKHALLMHGDSEKSASFNPVAGMFTKIFVAGKAGAGGQAAERLRIDLAGAEQHQLFPVAPVDIEVVLQRLADGRRCLAALHQVRQGALHRHPTHRHSNGSRH
mgnify:CR=1 FL=1